jgi:hypothetical protein
MKHRFHPAADQDAGLLETPSEVRNVRRVS